MRDIIVVIDAVLAVIPSPAPSEVLENMLSLEAELAVIKRNAAYTANATVSADSHLWWDLTEALRRFMPKPTAYPWAQQVSDIVRVSA